VRELPIRTVVNGIAAVAAVIIAIVLSVSIWDSSGGPSGHTVTTVVPSAGYVEAGNQVRAAGQIVGTVQSVTLTTDHQARVVLGFGNSVWPLPVDTQMDVRIGGTIRLDDRYVAVDLGHSNKTLPEGARFPASQYHVPVEVEDITTMFQSPVRNNLKSTIDVGGRAATTAATPLHSALLHAPGALRQVSSALADLGGQPGALDTLVRQSDAVAAQLNGNPGLGQLIDGAAATLRATASQATNLQGAISQAPATFADLRQTLSRADGTLSAADTLSRRLRLGAKQLGTLARPLYNVMASLVSTGPDAREALAAAGDAAPNLQRLLVRTSAIMPVIGETSRQATPQLACIRPYSPEIAGFASDWGAGAWSRGDKYDKFVRAVLGASQVPYVTPLNSEQLHQLLPGVQKIEFRPPGDLVDQPWFQPKCGEGPNVLSPSYDPEKTSFDPLSRPASLSGSRR
jgi:phospholipid/cholesterol/gamma-HCH transport system substrate-binding protein